eukprot:TRINITY_DN23543_c0_g1_i5.p1 TRINITY_DN23543_c0_g1~~TRINITY_DN23543_c0_g1_i5.p1  ORF type:complete len:381 (-),score=39.78 TRINITY_DN23543_c0_g1_i5:256-1359(-)
MVVIEACSPCPDSTAAQGAPSLLVGDVLVHHPDLAGLDVAVEIFALDAIDADAESPSWGPFWAEAFADAPPLPVAMRRALPEEGGFVMRPITRQGSGQALSAATLLMPQGNSQRLVLAPPRRVHAELGFPEPTLVSNDIFCEIRYAMSPSVVKWLDFDDIRDGTLRIFVIPDFEGDARVITIVDEASASLVLAQTAVAGFQRKRLLQFLHAAATAPAAARWPTTADVAGLHSNDINIGSVRSAGTCENEAVVGSLFPHQRATVEWMRRVEAGHTMMERAPEAEYVNVMMEAKGTKESSIAVSVIDFAGVSLGSSYEVCLPRGALFEWLLLAWLAIGLTIRLHFELDTWAPDAVSRGSSDIPSGRLSL